MARIHPTAIVEEGAVLDSSVEVGAYAFLGPEVEIGPGTVIAHHATVEGRTRLGRENHVYPYAFLGGRTHDLKHRGGTPGLRVGDGNTFREYTTVHCATDDGEWTRIGNGNTVLAYSHIAHDCQVGDHLIMSSHAALGGHVLVGDHANIGWGSGVHQFCRIGAYAMVGAATKLVRDLPPFFLADGNPAEIKTINRVGLERAGFSPEAIRAIHHAYRLLHREGLTRKEAITRLRAEAGEDDSVRAILAFLEESER